MPKKLDPQAAIEIMRSMGLEPQTPYLNISRPWLCICMICGKEVSPSLWNIKTGKTKGCRFCNSKKKLNPQDAIRIMIEAGVNPIEPFKNIKHKWKCVCLICDKNVTPIFDNVRRGSKACRYCARKSVDPIDALAYMREIGFEPQEVYKGGGSPWKCICSRCGEVVYPKYSESKAKGHTCKHCAGLVVDPRSASEYMTKNGYIPLEEYPGSHKKWKCIHVDCNKTTYTTYNNIKSGWGGCSSCAPNAPLNPKEMHKFMISKKLVPLEPYPGSMKPWKCRCVNCGKDVSPTLSQLRNRGGRGCGYCAGKKTDKSEVIQKMLRAGFEPLSPFEKTQSPWKSKCLKCGEISFPRYKDVIHGGTECKYCTQRQFDYSTPSYLYIMYHSDFDSFKIGISNHDAKKNRVSDHKKNGWQPVKIYNFDTGKQSEICETDFFTWLRRVRLFQQHLLPEQMPQGGHTETVSADSITALEIQNKVEELMKGYRNTL